MTKDNLTLAIQTLAPNVHMFSTTLNNGQYTAAIKQLKSLRMKLDRIKVSGNILGHDNTVRIIDIFLLIISKVELNFPSNQLVYSNDNKKFQRYIVIAYNALLKSSFKQ